ncbi:MAG: glycoside hydrolase family 16 protein [bacterium]|jgi:beta-glucanase (GH16 family)
MNENIGVARVTRRTFWRRWFLLLALVSLALTGWGGRCNGGDPLELEPDGPGDGDLELVWEDEFEGPAGQLPDADKWGYDIGGSGWGNAQLEYDTDRPTNVSLDGEGHLAITAREEEYLGREYTSARINTKGLFQQTRGRFEARIKLPIGQGIWPAFWMLGADFETVGWPDCGEIDIMEYRGQEPNILHGSLHGPGYSGGGALTRSYTLPGAEGFNDDFHVFAVEWESDALTWFVDSTSYYVVTPGSLPDGGSWVFDHPFFIILNVAVGGYFVGSPDATTTFPQTMLVDWVRVYRSAP